MKSGDKIRVLWMLAAVVLLVGPVSALQARAARELTAEEMDRITAGSVSVAQEDGAVNIRFQSSAGSGRSVDGAGTIEIFKGVPPAAAGSLVLQDSAQSHLQSLININAVNSFVQVLLNLNVNINSTVGTVRQINLSGTP